MLKMRRDLFQILYDRQMLRAYFLALAAADRSEERRVGKEC